MLAKTRVRAIAATLIVSSVVYAQDNGESKFDILDLVDPLIGTSNGGMILSSDGTRYITYSLCLQGTHSRELRFLLVPDLYFSNEENHLLMQIQAWQKRSQTQQGKTKQVLHPTQST